MLVRTAPNWYPAFRIRFDWLVDSPSRVLCGNKIEDCHWDRPSIAVVVPVIVSDRSAIAVVVVLVALVVAWSATLWRLGKQEDLKQEARCVIKE